MSYRVALIPVNEKGEDSPLLKEFYEAALDREAIEKVVWVIPEIIQFVKNAKLETKLSLLSGKFVGKENEVYLREQSLDWFAEYLQALPIKIAEARQKQLLEEAKKNTNK